MFFKLTNHHFLLKILVGIIATSCTLKQIKNESPQINLLEIKQKYKINLPENHSNGYIWQLNDDYDRTIIDNLNTVWHGNENGVDFNFNTLSAGQTTLTFVSRKFTDTGEIKHFIVQIRPK